MLELERAADVVDEIVRRVGTDLRVGTPLAAGKPNHILNALYARAKRDPSLNLTILTALTLEKPKGSSDLEARFLGPFADRVFGDYPDLAYELDRAQQALPGNVRVIEFYFPPGKFVNNPTAQRDHISTNYTHAARDLLDRGVNVLAMQVAREDRGGQRFLSLSCNPDVAVDVMEALRGRDSVAFVAQVNRNLPFMYGDAEVDPEDFDILVDNPDEDYRVFGPPKLAVSAADHMIGLYVSALVQDGGELQVGIGAIGDAVVDALRLRHNDNATYRAALAELSVLKRFGDTVEAVGALGTFERGLFSASEMLVDGFLDLLEDGIIKRRVYDDVALQRLLNEEKITEQVTPATLRYLLRERAVHPVLTPEDVRYLVHFGVFQQGVRLEDGQLCCPDGMRITADLRDEAHRAAICVHALGSELRHGAVMHAGFFLGPQAMYERLRTMPEEQRRLIRMRSVRRINQLYGHEEVDRLHRVDGRFVNTAMVATLLGAAASDALEDGRVVSGVGGQYNFVAMAHELPGGRSILNLRSTRRSKGRLVSNIVSRYGHVTIPRHLRDIVVTEYGIASLRGRTDEEVVQAMLAIADSRFQPALVAQAKRAGKLAPAYEIPARHRNNLPQAYEAILARFAERGCFQRFPLGCDFTPQELALGAALKHLRARTSNRAGLLGMVLRALWHRPQTGFAPYLARMGFERARSARDHLYRRLLCIALADTGTPPLPDRGRAPLLPAPRSG